jgi:hypothetical protein
VSDNSYEYLLPYQNVITQWQWDVTNYDEVKEKLAPYMQMSYKALFEVMD